MADVSVGESGFAIDSDFQIEVEELMAEAVAEALAEATAGEDCTIGVGAYAETYDVEEN